MRNPRRRATTLAVGALLLAGALGGCSAVGDVASAAGDGASSAAVSAAQRAALTQVCGLVADGRVSDSDLTTLRRVVATAKAAGVQGDVVDTADRVLGQEGGLDDGQVEQLQTACADAGQTS